MITNEPTDLSAPMQVPFMRNWFKDQYQTEFTVMLWFKRNPSCNGTVGLVHNGDCVDEPTFLIYGDESVSGSKEVVGGFDTDGFPLTYTNPISVSWTWRKCIEQEEYPFIVP